jgi:hypothetical protein
MNFNSRCIQRCANLFKTCHCVCSLTCATHVRTALYVCTDYYLVFFDQNNMNNESWRITCESNTVQYMNFSVNQQPQ